MIMVLLAFGFTVAMTTFVVQQGHAIRDSLRALTAVELVTAHIRAVRAQYHNAPHYQVPPPFAADLAELSECKNSVASAGVPAHLVSCRLLPAITAVALPGADQSEYNKWFPTVSGFGSQRPAACGIGSRTYNVGDPYICAARSSTPSGVGVLVPISMVQDTSASPPQLVATANVPRASGYRDRDFLDRHTFPYVVNLHDRADSTVLTASATAHYSRLCRRLVAAPPAHVSRIGMYRGGSVITRQAFGQSLTEPLAVDGRDTDATRYAASLVRSDWVVDAADAITKLEAAGGCALHDVLVLFVR